MQWITALISAGLCIMHLVSQVYEVHCIDYEEYGRSMQDIETEDPVVW
jgi:hypothetical protein